MNWFGLSPRSFARPKAAVEPRAALKVEPYWQLAVGSWEWLVVGRWELGVPMCQAGLKTRRYGAHDDA